MKKYHVIKQSRCYEGQGYCGHSSDDIPQEFDTLEEARESVSRLLKRNAVGWSIYDSYNADLIKSEQI